MSQFSDLSISDFFSDRIVIVNVVTGRRTPDICYLD